MASTEMRARAIIEAVDRTNGVFERIGERAKRLDRVSEAMARSNRLGAVSEQANKLATSFDLLTSKQAKLNAFRDSMTGFTAARAAFREAEERVKSLARQMNAAGEAPRALARDYEKAQRAVKAASAAFSDKAAAVKSAKASLADYGVTLRNIGKAERDTAAALAAARRAPVSVNPVQHAATKGQHAPAAPTDAGGTTLIPMSPKMLGPLAVGYAGMKMHGAIVDQHHDYQRAYLYQRAVLGYSAGQQTGLMAQAENIGKDTKFTNADVVKAQTDIGSKLPKNFQTPETIAGITEQVKNYSLAMEVTMQEGAEAIVGRMKALGYDLSSPEAATASAKKTANSLVEFAKTSGAKHHDVGGYTKFGLAPGRVGGFSSEFTDALAAQLIRLQYDGAMAGTFVRAAAMKLSAPSKKTFAAISSLGLNYDNYVTPGTDLSVGGFDKMLKQRFGRGVDGKVSSQLQEIFDDDAARGDRAAFIEKVSEALNGTFARKTNKGTVNAQDAERIAKTADEFFTLTQKSVDTEKMMRDIVGKGLTAAVARYLFGAEHGGRAVGLNPRQLDDDVKAYKNTPGDRAESVGKIMQEGAQGEYMKMVGSMQTFVVALGEATDGARQFAYRGIGAMFDGITNLVNDTFKGPPKFDESKVPPTGNPVFDFRPKHRVSAAALEASQRRQDYVSAYPEAARGEAFNKIGDASKLEATVKPDQIKAELEGKADVNVAVTVKVEPSGNLITAVETARSAAAKASGPLRVNTNGAGSTGVSSPDAR